MRILMVIAIFALASPTLAVVINVPADFLTIQEAVDAAVSGDEILIAPGTYAGNVTITGKDLTIRGSEGAATTIVDGEGVMRGFTITDSTSTVEGITFQSCLDRAIYMFGGSLTILDCTFDLNIDPETVGTVALIEGSMEVRRCLFTNNIASFGGGIYIQPGSGPFLAVDTEFRSNSAVLVGGAATIFAGQTGLQYAKTFTNCLFITNDAGRAGGAVYISFADPAFINCTFDGNTSVIGGPALFSNNFSLPTVTNSIFSNHATTAIVDSDSFTLVTFSNLGAFAGANASALGNTSADPLYMDPPNGDYRLSADSPCIDAGFSWAVPATISLDKEGKPRFADRASTPNTGCGSAVLVDMGAYEFQGIPGSPCRGDTDGSGNTNVTDLLTLLASWGMCGTSCCIADFDGSGFVNVTDLLTLLAAWGACP